MRIHEEPGIRKPFLKDENGNAIRDTNNKVISTGGKPHPRREIYTRKGR
jgi:hypothetical protein